MIERWGVMIGSQERRGDGESVSWGGIIWNIFQRHNVDHLQSIDSPAKV